MKINVPLVNGYLPDKYTKHAPAKDKIGTNPIVSFPIKIASVPEKTASLAIVLLDDDAIPVCGFTFIHWVAANIDPKTTQIPENSSQDDSIKMTLGKNSLAGGLINEQNPVLNEHYTGPTPPDQPHNYHLYVYALDQILDLQDGFWLNELQQKINQHLLAVAEQVLPVKN
ncbi:hypothetical protein BGL34_03275 [Fructilactobacillus lindneri]|uniref:YbhB YbcL family protein n=2 Tax=Fructilactobacillus lindneri TaxID=53444 RepID=A0A0R2JVS5_9LACO|nr:YbhB/YbcL family Raf kinase inhibitor-like protein [Fructilactobacillus lindneri]ANZ57849.1 hypothetical protein AYR60_03255 [Fructilactobacillus lindneri]ANZ59118.1 hypothetical protein AYR59_03255 [Fructilactobacillus lindneri]KRN78695.1 YbhB YbcL family protein [Fructilactobacillus lindneri DSM 20690 = JCM 11027]POG98170.1 hypothetical protein BGL31_03585 [Fructilactobacillus lindneri]POH01714.1 hypothetical protein BGL32_03845 [Fructilactobacillus lindneri]